MNNFFKYGFIVAGISMAVGIVFALVSTAIGGRIVLRNSSGIFGKLDYFGIVRELADRGLIREDKWGSWADEEPKELRINGETVADAADSEAAIEESAIPEGSGQSGASYDGTHHDDIHHNGTYYGETKELSPITEPGQISASGIRNLELTLGAGQFYIREKDTDDGMISISVQGIGDCDYYTGKDTLYVESFKGKHFFGEDLSKNQVIIELPKGISFDEVELTCGAGIAEIVNLTASELEIEVGAGEVRTNNVNVRKFSANIGAGRVDASNMSAQEANLEVGMGECVYQGTILRELDAECDLGNMDIRVQGAMEDYNYEIECSAGNINLGGKSITGLAAERNIYNGAPGTFELSCNMGNISVSFSE